MKRKFDWATICIVAIWVVAGVIGVVIYNLPDNRLLWTAVLAVVVYIPSLIWFCDMFGGCF